MGLIRKAASVSTLGVVKFRSNREQKARAASAQAVASREEARLLREQRKALHHEGRQNEREDREEQLKERREAAEGKPWWQQPTVGDALRARKRDSDQER